MAVKKDYKISRVVMVITRKISKTDYRLTCTKTANNRGAKLGGAAGALAPPIILDFTK